MTTGLLIGSSILKILFVLLVTVALLWGGGLILGVFEKKTPTGSTTGTHAEPAHESAAPRQPSVGRISATGCAETARPRISIS